MNDLLLRVWTAIIWAVNGFLVLAYLAADNILVILLVISVVLFAIRTPPSEHKGWVVISGVFAGLAAFFSPFPVPPFLLTMSLAGWVVQYLEKYNRPAQRWNTVKNLITYSSFGLFYALVLYLGWLNPTHYTDPMTIQGMGYMATIASIAMFIMPIAFVAMAIQTTLALPPSPGGSPEELITSVRTRGKE